MERVHASKRNKQKLWGELPSSLEKNDPELAGIRDRLLYGEIAEHSTLNDSLRILISLVTLVTNQNLDSIKPHTEAALRIGVSPMEIREALYQCVPYIGFPKTESALRLVNEVFTANGVKLPLEGQATVTEETRLHDGMAVQKGIFGDSITRMHMSTPDQQKELTINYLSAFCFGDIYTRKTLDLNTRELLTFSIISALGGCESQVKSHVQGNAAVGNSKQTLIDALTQMLPYIGFPRVLNALSCVNAVLQDS